MAWGTPPKRSKWRTVSLPVAYRSERGRLVIDVLLPDKKTWWRNFTEDGAPLTVRLDGVDRLGQATAVRDGDRVRIEVDLSPADGAPPAS